MSQTNKFELLKLDSNNLQEFDQWEQKMNELVEQNPFIEITDSATYDEAKKRRTNLRTGRTDVEKQDKTIGSFLSNFRKNIKSKTESLTNIVRPHEDKQQEEVTKWENKIAEEKAEKERKEQQRADAIKNDIEFVCKELEAIIGHIIHSNIEEAEKDFEKVISRTKDELDFQEFQFIYDEKVVELKKEFEAKIKQVSEDFEKQLQEKKKNQELEFNKLLVEAQKTIDEFNPTDEDSNLIEMIDNVFDSKFEFGEFTPKLFEEKSKYINKALERLDDLREKELEQYRKNIVNVREGLLDQIFQMTTENFEDVQEEVKQVLKQSVPEGVEDEFNKMKSVVEKSLEQKMVFINDRIERHQKTVDERINKIESLGLKNDGEDVWVGYGLRFAIDQIWNESFFDGIIEEIETAKENSEKEKKRQEALKDDKQKMTDYFVEMKNNLHLDKKNPILTHQDSFVYFVEMKKQLIEICDQNIISIQKF